MEPDLDQLMRRAQAGDRPAFDAMVAATAPGTRAYLALHLDLADVDDVAQEVYLHLYDHLADYRPGSSLLAWLRTVARLQALARLRERQRRHAAHGRYVAEMRTMLADEAESLPVDGGDLVARLRHCLARLSATARAVIESRYFAGASVQAIAADRGESANQVSVTLWRSRQALARCLETPGEGA
jgi:RNA polymerase sigma-70 factor (ECF subfamily)